MSTVQALIPFGSSKLPLTLTSYPILNLPQPIFHVIFGDYLKLDDIARFDNAVLNHQDRILYLDFILNMVVKSRNNNISQPYYFLRWLHKRRILLSSVYFDFEDGPIKNTTFVEFPLNVTYIETVNLLHLHLCGPHLALVESLKKCTMLKRLYLKSEYPEMEVLFDIPTFCCKLESISLSRLATDNVLLKIARFCPDLHSISFHKSGERIDESNLIEFLRQRGAGLTTINLGGIRYWSEDVAMSITKNCPNLERLTGLIEITDKELKEFGKLCPMLKNFSLMNDTSWTDTGLSALAEGCRYLKELNIHSDEDNGTDICAVGITDASILKLTESCQYLEKLSLIYLPSLTDESMYAIARNCKFLKSISLEHLTVSSEGLKIFCASPSLRGLESIDFSFVKGLTDDCILELVKNIFNSLYILSISSCVNVSDISMSYVATYCIKLQDLVLSNLPYILDQRHIVDILERNPDLTNLFCDSLGRYNRICDENSNLSPILQELVDKNIKHSIL